MRHIPFSPPRAALPVAALICAIAGSAQAQECPDFTQNGVELSYDSNELYSPRTHEVLAGGAVNLALCGELPGIGFVGAGPDFTVTYTAGSGRALSISATSACDTVILVNGPTMTWEFDDDSAGDLDPVVWFADADSGIYDIWIGTIDEALCDAALTLETFD